LLEPAGTHTAPRSAERNGALDNQTRRGRPNGKPASNQQRATKTLSVPKTDFDFESANARLKKEDIEKEIKGGDSANVDQTVDELGDAVAKLNIPDVAAYDKKSSFFDNISCDAVDRLQQPEG
jgi:protein LSM14